MRKTLPVLVAATVALVALVLIMPALQREPDTRAGEAARGGYVRAAHWFGGHWAINFWNTDLEARAQADFAKFKEDGFNTVVLLVPWPGFAPDPQSGELDATRVERLRTLMRLAGRSGLDVILRVSYAYDGLDEERGWRNYRVWMEDAVYQGWLEFMESIWNAVGSEPNLLFGFYSWEDLWAIMRVLELSPAERLTAAHASGFVRWLSACHSLEAVSDRYHQAFESWDEVPVPERHLPAFEWFLEFVNQSWIERFFVPARQRFPRLSMEIRMDADPIIRDDGTPDFFFHDAAWNLPDAEWVTIYWAPSMGGENAGELLSPEIAAERLEWWLERVAALAGPRQIFIGQFLVEDFTPGYEKNGRIPRDQVPEFLALADDILGRLTAGYSLWAWSDYDHNAIANPEFYVGLDGWKHGGAVDVGDEGVRLASSAWINYPLPLRESHVPGGAESAELCVQGRALSDSSGRVRISDSPTGDVLGVIDFSAEDSERCVQFDVGDFVELELKALDEVLVRRVESVGFVQRSGMRDRVGNLKPVGAAYRELNSALVERPPVTRPRYEDGWMGRYLVTRFEPGERGASLRLTTYLPDDWPLEPVLTVSVDGRVVDRVPCANGGEYAFPVDSGIENGRSVEVSIEASEVHEPPNDSRPLGCLIHQLELVP